MRDYQSKPEINCLSSERLTIYLNVLAKNLGAHLTEIVLWEMKMDTNEGMRKCGKNILNNRYEQQVQAAMDRHAKSKERCMLQAIDQGVIDGAMDATSDG